VIGNRQSAIGNRQSAIGNRQSAIGNNFRRRKVVNKSQQSRAIHDSRFTVHDSRLLHATFNLIITSLVFDMTSPLGAGALTHSNNKLINIFQFFFNERNEIVLLNFNAFQSTNLTKPI